MSELQVDVQVVGAPDLPLDPRTLVLAVTEVLRAESIDAAEISITLVPDAEIERLNEQYLSHAGPTDVLSFPLHLDGQPPLGDVYIGFEQAMRQAEENGVPPAEELLRLAIHGTLHILGYDHPEVGDRESSPMYRRQESLLASILRGAAPGA